jgi:hypothetical protein
MAFSTLLHSVSYSGSWGQARLPVDDFVGKAAELGFQGVMLMAKRPHLSVLDYDAQARKALRRLIEQSGLRAVCIAGYSNFTADLEHAEIPMREMQIHYVTELAQLAHDLGGGLIRIYTGYEHPSAGYLAQWNLVVDALRECADRAAPLGVTIGIQNHHDIAVDYRSRRTPQLQASVRRLGARAARRGHSRSRPRDGPPDAAYNHRQLSEASALYLRARRHQLPRRNALCAGRSH